MMQPDPRSGEGCITLLVLHEGFANTDTRKRMLYRHCYITSLQAQIFTIQSKKNILKYWPRASLPLMHACGGLQSHLSTLWTSSVVCFSNIIFFKRTPSLLADDILSDRASMGMKPSVNVY